MRKPDVNLQVEHIACMEESRLMPNLGGGLVPNYRRWNYAESMQVRYITVSITCYTAYSKTVFSKNCAAL